MIAKRISRSDGQSGIERKLQRRRSFLNRLCKACVNGTMNATCAILEATSARCSILQLPKRRNANHQCISAAVAEKKACIWIQLQWKIMYTVWSKFVDTILQCIRLNSKPPLYWGGTLNGLWLEREGICAQHLSSIGYRAYPRKRRYLKVKCSGPKEQFKESVCY